MATVTICNDFDPNRSLNINDVSMVRQLLDYILNPDPLKLLLCSTLLIKNFSGAKNSLTCAKKDMVFISPHEIGFWEFGDVWFI